MFTLLMVSVVILGLYFNEKINARTTLSEHKMRAEFLRSQAEMQKEMAFRVNDENHANAMVNQTRNKLQTLQNDQATIKDKLQTIEDNIRDKMQALEQRLKVYKTASSSHSNKSSVETYFDVRASLGILYATSKAPIQLDTLNTSMPGSNSTFFSSSTIILPLSGLYLFRWTSTRTAREITPTTAVARAALVLDNATISNIEFEYYRDIQKGVFYGRAGQRVKVSAICRKCQRSQDASPDAIYKNVKIRIVLLQRIDL